MLKNASPRILPIQGGEFEDNKEAIRSHISKKTLCISQADTFIVIRFLEIQYLCTIVYIESLYDVWKQ